MGGAPRLLYLDVQLQILPLAESGVLVALHELAEDVASEPGEDLFDVRLYTKKQKQKSSPLGESKATNSPLVCQGYHTSNRLLGTSFLVRNFWTWATDSLE